MFVADVLIGKSIKLARDPTLRKPPMIQGTNRLYDSVSGNT